MCKQIIAVGGGKGGVGKSVVAANLAVTASQNGDSVVLVDADLGSANLHTLLGINRPGALLEHFIKRKVESLEDVLIPTGIERLHLICGGMPMLGTANPKHTQKMRLIRHIRKLPQDVVIVDIGAGTGFNVLDLFNAASSKIVVMTPQLTSLHNGYGFLKAAFLRNLHKCVSARSWAILTEASPEKGDCPIKEKLRQIASGGEEEYGAIAAAIEDYGAFVVGNMLTTNGETKVISAISRMITDHLDLSVPVLGVIKRGKKIELSINQRHPFMLTAGIEDNAEVFRGMMARLRKLTPTSRPPRPAEPVDGGATYARRHPRYETSIAVSLFAQATRFLGTLQDISEGGVLVKFDDPVDPPADGHLTLRTPLDGKHIGTTVVERHRSGGGSLIGFSFVNLSRAAREAVSEILNAAQVSTAVFTTRPDLSRPSVAP